jgi:UTP:GlnB (protein PII) uridylyltransferase
MANEEINNVIDLIEKGKYEDALALMIEVQPLKDCEQNNPHHIYNVYDHILKTVEYVEYGLRSVVSRMTIEEHKKWFIDNEEELIKLFKLVMLLHDTGKPKCKKSKPKNRL